MDEGEPERADTPERRRRRKRDFVTALLLLFAFVVAVSWWQRVQIADDFLRRELERQGVRASYRIEEIGVRTQRIRNLVLGDPAQPDLVADEVEIDLGFGPTPQVTGLRVRGARLYGRWVDGRLSLGALDRFRDPTSQEPFALPFIRARLADVRARIETPAGTVAAVIDGEGWLDDGFDGRLTLLGRQLAFGGCRLGDVSYSGVLRVDEQRPVLKGPLRIAAMDCPEQDVRLANARLDVDGQIGARLDRASLTAAVATGGLRWAGRTATAVRGTVALQGGTVADGLDARYVLDLAAEQVRADEGGVGRLRVAGEGRLASGRRLQLSFRGRVGSAGMAIEPAFLDPLRAAARDTGATPIGPIVARIVTALSAASRAFDAGAAVDLLLDGGRGQLQLSDLALASASGVRARIADRISIADRGTGWNGVLAGTASFGGGGLPDGVLRLQPGRGGGFDGLLRLDAVEAGGATLALPELRFVSRADGSTALSGGARFGGPLAGGRIEGAELPISGTIWSDGRLAFYDRCVALAFRAASIAGLNLGPERLTACPDPGRPMLTEAGLTAARIAPAMLDGRIGGSPFQLSTGPVRLTGQGGFAFAAERVSTRIGAGDAPTVIALDRLDGRVSGGSVAGSFAGGAGQIGSVPLRLGEAKGQWRFAGGRLRVDGGLMVRDAATEARFQPMRMPDVALALDGDVISASGPVVEPESGVAIAQLSLRHALSGGAGHADFTVDGIDFGERLQPDQLTRLALGVVANVKGRVTGRGHIEWDGAGVRSTGSFATESLDLAAAFGPVTGARGTIRFADLLGLETDGSQEIFLAEANPGVAVKDGLVRYRILGGQRVAIEGGRWPFAGGALVLAPATLDFGEAEQRRLDFQVEGVDAAKLVELFNLGNLTATGVFDGTLPILFDDQGARIDGGALTSRAGGGTIAYVGELSYENLGFYGNYAFQALRSIRYRQLDISMNGNLGGEIITDVSFAGLQQGEGAKRDFITRQLAGLPIRFNVRISAPFMQLVNSVRGYYDPSLLIRQNLPALMEAQRQRDGDAVTPPASPSPPSPSTRDESPSIQPPASEMMP